MDINGYHVCARLFTFIYTVVRAQTMILAQKSQKSTKMTYKTNRLHPFGVRYCHYLKRTHLPKLPWGLAVSLGLWVWSEWLAIVCLKTVVFVLLLSCCHFPLALFCQFSLSFKGFWLFSWSFMWCLRSEKTLAQSKAWKGGCHPNIAHALLTFCNNAFCKSILYMIYSQTLF